MRQNLYLIFLICGLIFLPSVNIGQEVLIDEIEVSSSRVSMLYGECSRVVEILDSDEIKKSPANCLEDLLEKKLSIDVRERGGFGVQSDISLQGGSFDQVLILVDGISMNDPQTGHHTMNIPVDLSNIERIEILEGSASRMFGPNAFSGAINIITSDHQNEDYLGLTLSGGQHNLLMGTLKSAFRVGKVKSYITLSRNSADGYIRNTDFDVNKFYTQLIYPGRIGRFRLQAGWMDKQFGANSFYTPAYPDQFEQIRSYFGNLSFETGDKNRFKANVYARNHHDRFELFREDENFYHHIGEFWINKNDTAGFGGGYYYAGHNYHMTQIKGSNISFSSATRFGKTAIRANFRHEEIFSNVLGEPLVNSIKAPLEEEGLFTKSKKRRSLCLFLEHDISYKKIMISTGMSALYHENFDWSFSPGIDLAFALTAKTKLFANINQAVRIPTFTDLYYTGPTNLGNPNLKPEQALTSELGVKYSNKKVDVHLSIFQRKGQNIIDWVKLNTTDKWESRNITTVEIFGFGFNSGFNFQEIIHKGFFIHHIDLSYSYIDLKKSSGPYISKYALNNLKHKLVVGIDHYLFKNADLYWVVLAQDRNGSYSDYSNGNEVAYQPFVLVDARLRYHFSILEAFFEAKNIFNTPYRDYSNLDMPGRWMRLGVNVNLYLRKNKK